MSKLTPLSVLANEINTAAQMYAKGQKIRLDLSDREPFTLKAVSVEHIKSEFQKEGE